ncbi:hypothetical protein ACFE04_002997 [Oxalis oulophora]
MASFSSHNNLFILCIILCNTLYLITVVDSAFSEEISQAIELTRISKTTHLHFYFHDKVSGYHNGSTISIHGRNRISDDVREMPVVGGSGVFRFARGYALAHTFWFNNVGDAIVEYNVYVSH